VIPNPRLKRTLEPRDRLLCFGKLDAMRGLVPAKTRRKRKFKVQHLPEDYDVFDSAPVAEPQRPPETDREEEI